MKTRNSSNYCRLKEDKSNMPNDNTITENIYQELYRQITQHELRPGQNLTLTTLKKEFGVSHTPIREALTRLSADGLVTYLPNRGMRVVRFSETEIRELFQFTAELEVLALRFCSGAFTQAPLVNELETLIEEEKKALDNGDFARWSEVSGHYHNIFYHYSDNRYLSETAERMGARMELMSHVYSVPGYEMKIHNRHIGICEAVKAQDFDLAAERIRAHLQFSMMQVLDELRS